MPAGHDLAGAHRDGLLRHIPQGLEPALPNLLLLAPFVQLHHLVGKIGFKVGRRVVEGDMPVLPDADHPHVHDLPAQFCTQGGDVLLHVAFPVHEVGCLEVHLGDEALLQVLAEARDVALAQGDVLVQVKHFDFAPVDILLRQRLHRLELARTGGKDDPRLTFGLYRLPEQVGYLPGRLKTQLLWILCNRNGNAHTFSYGSWFGRCPYSTSFPDTNTRLTVMSRPKTRRSACLPTRIEPVVSPSPMNKAGR